MNLIRSPLNTGTRNFEIEICFDMSSIVFVKHKEPHNRSRKRKEMYAITMKKSVLPYDVAWVYNISDHHSLGSGSLLPVLD